MSRIYPAELSCVGGVYSPVSCRDLVYNSVTIGYGCRIVNWVTTADRCVHTAYMTQLDFIVGKFVQTHRDCRQLSATQYTPPTRLNSTAASRRRCVLGFSYDSKRATDTSVHYVTFNAGHAYLSPMLFDFSMPNCQ